MYLEYEPKSFSTASQQIIDIANRIIEEYQAQGFTLTLRQIYYQFVARDLITNTIQSYKRIGSIINDARLAGLVSWTAIEDRTRNLRGLTHWKTPREIMGAVVDQYRMDKWAMQTHRPEVWIEKEALVGVIAGVCERFDVPYFACRGYNSQSEQWAAGRRFQNYIAHGQQPIVFHLGDHDPSGIDMTRDNADRLSMFALGGPVPLEAGIPVKVNRLALNIDQIRKYKPPPNPAKLTDSRCNGYILKFGKDSWELDALDPQVIVGLVEKAIEDIREDAQWQNVVDAENYGRGVLSRAMAKM